MNFIKYLLLIFVAVFFISCGNDKKETGDTGNSGNTGDSGNSGDSGDTFPDNGNSGNTGDTGDTGDSGNTGNSGNTGDTGNTGDSGKCDCNGKEYLIPDQFKGIDGWCMNDDDEDGIPNCIEVPNGIPVDTDENETPDYLDTDSDGDGIPDSVECSEVPCKDTDKDDVPDYRDTDSDDDAILDSIECSEQPCVDTDEDGTPDYLDTDSDGDGIPDIHEGMKDPDKDGIPNFRDLDSDGDGISDEIENAGHIPPLDSDKDLTPDYLDIDSDNDGLIDEKELEIGTNPKKADTDGDGVDDNTENAAGSNPNVADPEWWEGKYYVILPYNAENHEIRPLDFSTEITKADILFMIDLSGSMEGEIANLKDGINNTLIGSIKSKIPDVGFGINTFEDYDSFPADYGTRVIQHITTNETTLKNTMSTVNALVGTGWEPQMSAIYFSVTGNKRGSTPAVDCSSSEGSIGGACFRPGAMPIFIMMTDEAFEVAYSKYKVDGSDWLFVSLSQAISSLNGIKGKFIGVDSWNSGSSGASPANDLKAVSNGTGSVDGSGNPFYYLINSNGTGLSTNVANAVEYLAANVPMLVNTGRESITNPQSVDVTQFIKAVTPVKRVVGGNTVNCPTECTSVAFENVKPGTTVTFNIDFYNDFYQPETSQATAFRAKINVFGEGSLVDTREVYIIVPGKAGGIGPGS